MKTRSGALFGHEDKALLLEKLQLQLHKTTLLLDGLRAMRSTTRFEEVTRTQHLTYDTEADRFLAAQAEGLRELQAGVERILAADASRHAQDVSSSNTSRVASEDKGATVPTLPKLCRHHKPKNIAPNERKTSLT